MKIREFADKMRNAVQELQAVAILQEYLASFSITSFAFTYYSGHIKTGRKLQYHCVSPALRAWHLHYLEQGYADVDRTLEESHSMTLPLFWDVQTQLISAKNKREQRIREESIEFGIDKGLSLPVHGPHHDFVSLTLHQRKNETGLAQYEMHQYEWLSATQIFYHHIKKILSVPKTAFISFNLTSREKQCLALTAKAWRVEKIAKELSISERTVNFHLQNANKKIGTNNKYQAINKLMESDEMILKF